MGTPVDVAVVSFAQSTSAAEERNEPEMLLPVLQEAVGAVGLDTQDMGFVVSGSSDYVAGQPFSFVAALDAVGAWPPLAESHVEMDGAFALYEAWLRLQHGDIDTALVYGFGKPSSGDLDRVLTLQLDPYTVAPLQPGATALAALQARAVLDREGHDGDGQRRLAEVVARSLRDAATNPHALRSGERDVDDLLAAPYRAPPLRDHDCAPITDGCAAIVLATAERAAELTDTPVWIRGIDHRVDPQDLGVRDLTDVASARLAAEAAGMGEAPVDVAELHAAYAHEELLLRRALDLDPSVKINPSGGALAANPVMATGLIRIGEAASAVRTGLARRAVAHATQGPCLQQNLVAVLDREV